MFNSKKLYQSMPNFSEGRNMEIVERILDAFRSKDGVKVLDFHRDEEMNRLVVTVVGDAISLKWALVKAAKQAVDLLDLNKHEGKHLRAGVVDVIPVIPFLNTSLEECTALAEEIGEAIDEKLGLPVYYYGYNARTIERKDIDFVRQYQFEGLMQKSMEEKFKPDIGERMHPTAGAVFIGARNHVVMMNVDLGTSDLNVAQIIASALRTEDGGLMNTKTTLEPMEEEGCICLTIHVTDFVKTPLYRVIELLKVETSRRGLKILNFEFVGLLPIESLVHSMKYYTGTEQIKLDQMLEMRLIHEVVGNGEKSIIPVE